MHPSWRPGTNLREPSEGNRTASSALSSAVGIGQSKHRAIISCAIRRQPHVARVRKTTACRDQAPLLALFLRRPTDLDDVRAHVTVLRHGALPRHRWGGFDRAKPLAGQAFGHAADLANRPLTGYQYRDNKHEKDNDIRYLFKFVDGWPLRNSELTADRTRGRYGASTTPYGPQTADCRTLAERATCFLHRKPLHRGAMPGHPGLNSSIEISR